MDKTFHKTNRAYAFAALPQHTSPGSMPDEENPFSPTCRPSAEVAKAAPRPPEEREQICETAVLALVSLLACQIACDLQATPSPQLGKIGAI